MLWLAAAALVVNAAALLLASTLARAGRLPPLASRLAWLAALASAATALYSVHALRAGLRATETASAAERSVVLARETGRALDIALASLALAVILLLAVSARTLLSRTSGSAA